MGESRGKVEVEEHLRNCDGFRLHADIIKTTLHSRMSISVSRL